MKSTWRFVLKIVGLEEHQSLLGERMMEKVRGKCRRYCPEFDDYDDDLLYE